MRVIAFLLGLVVIVQIGGFAFLWQHMSETPAPALAIGFEPSTLKGAVQHENEDALRESLRAIVRQELENFGTEMRTAQMTGAAAQPVGSGPVAKTEVAATRITAGSRAAAEASRAVVDRALASGIWTDADNAEILKQAPRLTEAQRVEILDRIFGAINSQQLKTAGSLPSL
jgi:hypothetical protein